MKRTISKMLGIAALAIAGVAGSFTIATPAQAAVSCPVWPSPVQSSYPLNGHIYNCMPTPRNSAETTFQADVLNRINSGIANYKTDRTKLNTRNIDIVVTYDPVTAFARVGVTPGVGQENPIAPDESGRSFVFPNRSTTIQNPTTMVFVYTQMQYTALGTTIPSGFTAAQSTQLGGTVVHELGHQFDRIWSQQLGYAPTATSTITLNSNNANFNSAINLDGVRLTATDINDLRTKYPGLLVKPIPNPPTNPTININEIFAEAVAMNRGGGANSAEDTFLRAKFTCAVWYVTQMVNSGGTPPVRPDPVGLTGQCHTTNTTW